MDLLYPVIEAQRLRDQRYAETYAKLETISKANERNIREIKNLKEQVKNWKNRYIGVCLSSWNEVDEDEADSFADAIKEMEC